MTAPIDTTPEAIAALLEGVTPGPWALNGKTGPEPRLFGRSHRIMVQDLTAIFVAAWETDPDDAKEAEANARFIAASRELVPALAAEIARLTAERDEARAQVAARDAAMRNEGRRQAATICNMSYGDGLGAAHARILAALEPEGGE